ncbi:ABC transporter permease subunit [Streptomyces hiroshimensis]|uniref:Transporter n=1 Tax=Streptomyces hiroshimensis TaxID=66424 RepID=A0ABQ2YBG9_9ACTN|nr:ABC transporter permease subunit [Streptomyces hiroshimensis]GGX77891.1 transporter [Streptomyces hiroshimensis]
MKGTLWLAWRQQRALILTGAAVLLAVTAWVVIMRTDMTDFISSRHIDTAGCKGWDGGCESEATIQLLDDTTGPIRALGTLSAALPVLIGVFWGAPLIGRELESGTWKLALTQGVGAGRWFVTRFALAALCTVLGSAVLAALVAWWWSPVSNMLNGLYWHDGYIFNATGPAAVACALFGLAAGTAAGLLIRRTLPAMAVVLGAVVALRFALNTFRSDWISPQLWISKGDASRREIGSGWSTGEFGYLDAAGHRIRIPDACPVDDNLARCMAGQGYVGRYRTVFPSSDFWTFQWIETGIFLGLAAVLIAGVCVVLKRRPLP